MLREDTGKVKVNRATTNQTENVERLFPFFGEIWFERDDGVDVVMSKVFWAIGWRKAFAEVEDFYYRQVGASNIPGDGELQIPPVRGVENGIYLVCDFGVYVDESDWVVLGKLAGIIPELLGEQK